MQEIQVQSLEQEDPLEKEMATHSSILPYLENSMNRGAWQATVHEVTKESDATEQLTLSLFHFLPSSCRNTFVFVVHSLSSVKLFLTPRTAEHQASLSTWDRNT